MDIDQQRPFSVNELVALMQQRGDKRNPTTINKFIVRAINSGELQGSYKADPAKQTTSWQIPVGIAEEWLKRPEAAKECPQDAASI